MRVVWATCGLLCVGLGILGVFLPLLPTTPFMLLAAWCFARSSERLHRWLLTHRTFGPIIENWNQHRAIPRKAKWYSVGAMAAAFLLSLALGLRWEVLLAQGLVLCVMGSWIMTRPDGPGAGEG